MSDDRSIAKLEAENYRLRTAISNINLRRQLKELQAGTWPLCARCQSRQAGPFGDVDGNLICGRCFFSDASPDSSEPAEDPASEPCCHTVTRWADDANETLLAHCQQLEGDNARLDAGWVSSVHEANGLRANVGKLNAENTKLRSLLTRVEAVEWQEMAPAFLAEIREALKGD